MPTPIPEQGGIPEHILAKFGEIGCKGSWFLRRYSCSCKKDFVIEFESRFSSQPLAISIPFIYSSKRFEIRFINKFLRYSLPSGLDASHSLRSEKLFISSNFGLANGERKAG